MHGDERQQFIFGLNTSGLLPIRQMEHGTWNIESISHYCSKYIAKIKIHKNFIHKNLVKEWL